MATWITHLRIAEHFMNNKVFLNNTSFLVGNIAPDCGVPNKDYSAFNPDKSITHWKTDENKANIDADSFKQRYLKSKNEHYPFYLGYYFHLVTDIEWGKFYHLKKQEPLYAEGFKNDENFIWTVKNDWYGQDCIYLQQHKDFVFYTQFIEIDNFPNTYFDFYSVDAFVRRIRYIKRFYQLMINKKTNREFLYLLKEENDKFVKDVITVLENVGFS